MGWGRENFVRYIPSKSMSSFSSSFLFRRERNTHTLSSAAKERTCQHKKGDEKTSPIDPNPTHTPSFLPTTKETQHTHRFVQCRFFYISSLALMVILLPNCSCNYWHEFQIFHFLLLPALILVSWEVADDESLCSRF